MVDYQQIYSAAEEQKDERKMLAALTVMVRIRPDHSELVARKDKLNRDINLSTIRSLEDKVQKALAGNKFDTAAVQAKKLLKIESTNDIAKKAMDEIRFRKKQEINKVKVHNPRKAMQLYNSLLKVSNWKTYRQERDVLKARVTSFDARVSSPENHRFQAPQQATGNGPSRPG